MPKNLTIVISHEFWKTLFIVFLIFFHKSFKFRCLRLWHILRSFIFFFFFRLTSGFLLCFLLRLRFRFGSLRHFDLHICRLSSWFRSITNNLSKIFVLSFFGTSFKISPELDKHLTFYQSLIPFLKISGRILYIFK